MFARESPPVLAGLIQAQIGLALKFLQVKVCYPVIYIFSELKLSGGPKEMCFRPPTVAFLGLPPTAPKAWEHNPRGS